jgi:type IV secretory pathway VirB10-like protein
MNEEYLWEKSGEPDPEVQELEEILGVLRYQPKKLDLPVNVRPTHHRGYLSLIAIAATLVMALLAGFLWLSLKPNKHHEAVNAPKPVPIAPTPTVPEEKKNGELAEAPKPDRRSQVVAGNRHRRTVPPVSAATREAVLAKEQLMTALRLASEKLNMAQRKAQNPSLNQIRNQHRIS